MYAAPHPAADDFYHFDDETGEVVIRRPDTPSPWINYLSNGSLHAFVSANGGGCAWWRSPLNFRLTRFRGWMQPVDSPGFYLYVREADGTLWSPTVQPVGHRPSSWEARHAPGRTRFSACERGLRLELELFVAPDEDVLVWDVHLTAAPGAGRRVELFAYVEYGLLEFLQEQQWGYYIRNMFKTWHDAATEAQLYLYHHQSHPRLAEVPLVYFACNRPLTSATGDRQAFLGAGRGEARPLAVEAGRCGGEDLWCGDPCAALHVSIDADERSPARVGFFLGVVPRAMGAYRAALDELPRLLARLRTPGFVELQRDKLDAWWHRHLDVLQAELPEPAVARQLLRWTPVQCVHTGRYSRSFSQSASGIRGVGFRDTAQDMLAVAYRDPAWARWELLGLLRFQFEDGHAVHTCFPEDATKPWTSVHSDDHLWLPLLAHALVAETGDARLLDEAVPYLAEDAVGATASDSVWAHLLRALDFTESHLGAHGLPLTLKSDWNDCIGRFARAGRGESVMAAQQYVVALTFMEELARLRGDLAAASSCAARRSRQQNALSTHAWDGHWWRRAFDDDGQAVGSAAARHGQIWLNSQTWAVLSGCGTVHQQTEGMDAVARLLDTARGIKKLHPSFPTFPEDMDAFVGYSLGCGENGAIFAHANTWAVIAEARLGRADRAWKYFRQLLPDTALRTAGPERYQAEPYAYPSNIVGPENPRFGYANVSQVTGTAAWMDLAGTQHLLGLRPALGGLELDPVLPSRWPGYTARRRFRGTEVHIKVTREGTAGCGVTRLRIDGAEVPVPSPRSAVLPAARLHGRRTIKVEVALA